MVWKQIFGDHKLGTSNHRST